MTISAEFRLSFFSMKEMSTQRLLPSDDALNSSDRHQRGAYAARKGNDWLEEALVVILIVLFLPITVLIILFCLAKISMDERYRKARAGFSL